MFAITKLLFLALTVTATPLLHRDVITVQNDITQKIGPQIKTLHNHVDQFPASGLVGAIAIHSDALTLVATVNTATENVKSTGSFGAVSGTTIIADIQLQVPNLLATLVAIEAQKESWADISDGNALMLQDLQSLRTVFSNYCDAIIAASPLLLKPAAVSIKAQIAGAFTTAIAAYAAF